MSNSNNKGLGLAQTLVVVVGLAFAYTWYVGKQAVTNEVFESYRKEFRAEIDSLKTDIRFVKSDTDSLKKGQHVIYREVRKSAKSKSFLEELINFGL